MNILCNSCQTQYPDMCEDCKEVIQMQFEEDEPEPQKIFVGSGEDVCLTTE